MAGGLDGSHSMTDLGEAKHLAGRLVHMREANGSFDRLSP
jgi:hypothetical protein